MVALTHSSTGYTGQSLKNFQQGYVRKEKLVKKTQDTFEVIIVLAHRA